MRVRGIQLENFRCFEDLTLEPDPRFTLLVGANGAGKTSVLEGLSVALGAWLLGFPNVSGRYIQRDEMRLVKVMRGNVPSLEVAGVTSVRAWGEIAGVDVAWQRDLRSPTGRTTYGEARELRALAEASNARVPTGEAVDLPVIAYYGTGRLWVQKREQDEGRRKLGSILQGYRSCLDPAADQGLLEAWMAWREKARIQAIGEALDTGASAEFVHEPLLDAVAQAATNCIDGARRFYYSVNHEELRLDLEDGRTMPFRLLSDGYRNMLAMVADIAWRAARLNPHYGTEAARRARGVVLIDEIDLHLHPAWQRRVVTDLMRTFPGIQFVATTHSPQVISMTRPERIRILHPDGTVGGVLHAWGRDSNAILREIMGVPDRPEWMGEKIRQIEGLIAEERIEEARTRLSEVAADLGPHDALVSGLEWEIHDVEAHRAQDPKGT